MNRKLFIIASLSFSTIVILLGGYNCASQYDQSGPGPYGPPPGSKPHSPPASGPQLPGEPQESHCNRSYWREKIRELGTASAFIEIDRSNFEDFNLGQPINFNIDCSRLLLNMSKISGGNAYNGKLYLVYEQENSPIGLQYDSGSSEKENKFNTWYGSWSADSSGRTGAKFSAIFEHTKKEMAVILQINRVVESDVTDGEVVLLGYGDIWFKMFRQAFQFDYRKNDPCLRREGYIRHAQRKPPVPSWKCWFVPIGPYNCYPKGVDTSFSVPKKNYSGTSYAEPNLDIRSTPTCYKKYGSFLGLDINKAFNVDSGSAHP
ncbi:MAG: hypothetical protein OXB86_05435 [Bdellovibrionales bacterium]|nr:hypothetical protein [Bdellovibrionales bacterium]